MKNIDYDKYLAGLGDFETSQQNKIKKYLEEQCEKDEALRALYRPEKIKDCYDFIMNVARKRATGNTACIEDVVVYKMARDFYLEVLPTVAETPPEVSAATEKTVTMPDQEENRGEKEEEEAEDVVEVESCAMPEDVVQEMNADAQEDKRRSAMNTVLRFSVRKQKSRNRKKILQKHRKKLMNVTAIIAFRVKR